MKSFPTTILRIRKRIDRWKARVARGLAGLDHMFGNRRGRSTFYENFGNDKDRLIVSIDVANDSGSQTWISALPTKLEEVEEKWTHKLCVALPKRKQPTKLEGQQQEEAEMEKEERKEVDGYLIEKLV